ncbi:MAG: electron transfer flavoprotein subunit alpha/FixB family protein, partial [Bacteroidales bacterium]|nr:electron transfer flavoprotein subunit alpha/FixB family protein [Bacteroidales bacterium]
MNIADYKNVYVFAEQREGKIQNVALELLGKARDLADALNEKVCAVLLGSGIKDLAATLIAYGADEVLLVDDPSLDVYTTEPYAQAIKAVVDAKKPGILLLGATTIGRDLGPRLAARMQTGLTADCTELDIEAETRHLMMTRPAFGGNLLATIMCTDHRPQMSTVRPGVMLAKPADAARKGTVEDFKVQFDRSKFRVKVEKVVKEQKNLVDITAAKVLVSGGRGVGSADGFKKLEALAQVLGGEVASSRAMVDAGVTEHARQVGQT